MDTFNDKNLACADCGQEFVFSKNEQAFYAERGFTNEPKRCKNCRDKRKMAREGKSLDEVAENLRQAMALHLEDEDMKAVGFVDHPRIQIVVELPLAS